MANRYRTIVADPPWEYDDGFATQSRTPGKWTGQIERHALPYASLTVAEIAALPIAALAAPDARLFLWATNRYLPDAFGVLSAWSFTYKQTLTWDKSDALNGSVAPNSEFLIVGVRGSPPRLSKLPSAVIRRAQTKTHSRKPDVFLDMVEAVSPEPRLELFSRRARLGWDTWGDQALEHVTLEPVVSRPQGLTG